MGELVPVLETSTSVLLALAVAAYLLGSVPFGIVVSRLLGLGDPRKIGSGNIGATNVLRTGSKPAALLTVLLDGGKGFAAVLIARQLGGADAALLAAICAFLGHCYPLFLGFKGGKGVATYLGALLALVPLIAVIAMGVWLLTFLISRISSKSALFSAGLTPIAAFAFDHRPLSFGIALMSAILIWRHRENIRRLLAGTEPKTNFRKPSQ